MGLHRILYRSEAIGTFDDFEIQKLGIKAQVRNEYIDVTGVLIFCDNCFMQLIEGEEAVIKDLYYNKIYHDHRHRRIKVILQGDIKERAFETTRFLLSHSRKNGSNHFFNKIYDDLNKANLVNALIEYFKCTGEIDLRSFWINAKKNIEILNKEKSCK